MSCTTAALSFFMTTAYEKKYAPFSGSERSGTKRERARTRTPSVTRSESTRIFGGVSDRTRSRRRAASA